MSLSDYERLRSKIREAAKASRDGWAISDKGPHPMWANDEGWLRDLRTAGTTVHIWQADFWSGEHLTDTQVNVTNYWADQLWEPNDPKSPLELLAEQLAE